MKLKTTVISTLVALLLLTTGLFSLSAQAAQTSLVPGQITPEVKGKLASLQIPFIKNEGQVKDSRVKFYAKTFAGTAFVTDQGITYALAGQADSSQGCVVQETFAGGKALLPAAVGSPEVSVNYFVGSDKKQWQKGLPSYDEITLEKCCKTQ